MTRVLHSWHAKDDIISLYDESGGLVVKMSASQPRDHGFEP
jgi:hypothetical protein